jgi:hypothetical protein
VREVNGDVNHAAWRKEYSHLRDHIIATALAGSWTDEDFTKLQMRWRTSQRIGSATRKPGTMFGGGSTWRPGPAQIDGPWWPNRREPGASGCRARRSRRPGRTGASRFMLGGKLPRQSALARREWGLRALRR